jgi:hypothetical protein
MCKHNTGLRTHYQFAFERQYLLRTYSVCGPVEFVTQHAKRMRPIVIVGLSGYAIFFHIISQKALFSEKVIEKIYVFWFYVQILFVTFFTLQRIERDIVKNVYKSQCTVPQILVRLPRNLFIRHRLEKYSNIKFHEILPSGSQAISCGPTDRYEKATSGFSQFYELAQN